MQDGSFHKMRCGSNTTNVKIQATYIYPQGKIKIRTEKEGSCFG